MNFKQLRTDAISLLTLMLLAPAAAYSQAQINVLFIYTDEAAAEVANNPSYQGVQQSISNHSGTNLQAMNAGLTANQLSSHAVVVPAGTGAVPLGMSIPRANPGDTETYIQNSQAVLNRIADLRSQYQADLVFVVSHTTDCCAEVLDGLNSHIAVVDVEVMGSIANPGHEHWIVYLHELGHNIAGLEHAEIRWPALPDLLAEGFITEVSPGPPPSYEATVMVGRGGCPSPCSRLTTFQSGDRFVMQQNLPGVANWYEEDSPGQGGGGYSGGGGQSPPGPPSIWVSLTDCFHVPDNMMGIPEGYYGYWDLDWSAGSDADYVKLSEFWGGEIAQLPVQGGPEPLQTGPAILVIFMQACNEEGCSAPSNYIDINGCWEI